MKQLKFVMILIACFLILPVAEAKKRCKPLLKKLHNIQALQRSAHSAQRGLSLRNREDKARNKWWECENSSGKNKNKPKKKSKKKNGRETASVSAQLKRKKGKKITAGTPFKTSNAIVIKSKYQGEKKQAWLKYYQKPNKCILPKSLSIFAYCSENKLIQQAGFEKQYDK